MKFRLSILLVVLLGLLSACSSVVRFNIAGLMTTVESQKEIYTLVLSEVKEIFKQIDTYVERDCYESTKAGVIIPYCKTVEGIKKPYTVNVHVYMESSSIVLKYTSGGMSRSMDKMIKNRLAELLAANNYEVNIIADF